MILNFRENLKYSQTSRVHKDIMYLIIFFMKANFLTYFMKILSHILSKANAVL